ncbi:MAG: DNA cytosine methyltransferase [Bacillus subtilis]|nr:DNA cytosine methyltransferase [Bacillus subtilis]
MDRAFIGSWNNQLGVIRQLTPRECFNLMGFDGSFKIIDNRVHAYRQAGNSIVVDVLIALLSQILKACDLYE